MHNAVKFNKSLEYIEKNLDSKISLDDLAKDAYLSKYHYHRLFHKTAGEPVSRYIARRRMAKAASELAETDGRIVDIALKYQYNSQESFSRAFKKVYGMAPGEYRRKNLKNTPCMLAA